AARNSQLARHVENDVFGRRPPRELPGQVYRDMPGVEHLPGEPGHDVYSVSPADADSARPKAAGVWRVRIRANDQFAREGIMLQHHLVNDPGARPPKSGPVP